MNTFLNIQIEFSNYRSEFNEVVGAIINTPLHLRINKRGNYEQYASEFLTHYPINSEKRKRKSTKYIKSRFQSLEY